MKVIRITPVPEHSLLRIDRARSTSSVAIEMGKDCRHCVLQRLGTTCRLMDLLKIERCAPGFYVENTEENLTKYTLLAL